MSASGSVAEAIRSTYDRDWLAMGDRAVEGALLEIFHPEVVFVPEATGSRPTTPHVGVRAVARLFREARGDWDSCRYVLDRVEETAPDEVLVSGWLVADARQSGSRVSFRFAHLWTVRDKRVVRVAAYHDPEDAFAALTARIAA